MQKKEKYGMTLVDAFLRLLKLRSARNECDDAERHILDLEKGIHDFMLALLTTEDVDMAYTTGKLVETLMNAYKEEEI